MTEIESFLESPRYQPRVWNVNNIALLCSGFVQYNIKSHLGNYSQKSERIEHLSLGMELQGKF